MARRSNGNRGSRPAVVNGPPPAPRPLGAADNAAILAKLDAILQEQHELRRLVHRMTVVTDVLGSAAAAGRLGVSVRTLERVTARGVFTDARSPDRRVCGAGRVYYADEVEVYRSDGPAGVARLRRELGRG